MLIKNSISIINYLGSISKFKKSNHKLLSIRFLNQILILNNNIKNLNKKVYCLYTHKYHSVYRSFKMSRYKLKNFLDNRSLFNIYVK